MKAFRFMCLFCKKSMKNPPLVLIAETVKNNEALGYTWSHKSCYKKAVWKDLNESKSRGRGKN